MAVPNSRNSRPLLPIGGVSKEDAPQVIEATWQHAINVTRRPLIRADILAQLSWALEHYTAEIENILDCYGIMLCQKGLPDRHKHFTHFLHSTIMHVAGRAYQIRSRPNPDNAPIAAGKLRKQAAKAGIQLFKSLQALGPEDRGAFFDMIAAYCRKLDFIELDDHDPSLDYLRELSSAFPLKTLGPTCEFLLALLVRQQSAIPDHQPQLVNLEPEFVKTAAKYWEQPPVSLPLTRSTNSGSFDHFCMTVSKTFKFDLDPQQVTNGIKMLFEERKRPPKSPDERIYAHMKELDAQAQATLQELAEGLTGSDVARRR